MKCALVIPSWRPEDIFPSKTAQSQINYWQPLGTLYVAATLIEDGHDVRFFNGAFLSEDEIITALKEFSPDVVGLYSTAFGWKRAMNTARIIKEALKEVFVVVGGPYPVAEPAKCIQEATHVDGVVTGEGEYTMVELVRRLQMGMQLKGVRGLFYKDNNEIYYNEPMPLIQDLDALPLPARHLLGDPDRYIPPPATYRKRPVAVVLTSRGCNRRCIFCFQIDRDRKIRYRSIPNVISELEVLKEDGYREIKFIDDSLAADYNRAIELAEEMRLKRLGFTWFASACANQVDYRLLRAFKDAGCWAILIGAESGVQRNLNALRKGITVDQIKRAVRAAKDAGLKVFTPFIIGIPGQSREDILQTIEFACELDPDVVNFHCLTPFPGTELYKRVKEFGTISNDLEDYTYQGAAFIPYTLTREELVELRQYAFRRFYSRPSYLLKRLIGIRTVHDVKAAITGLKSLMGLIFTRGIFHRGSVKHSC